MCRCFVMVNCFVLSCILFIHTRDPFDPYRGKTVEDLRHNQLVTPSRIILKAWEHNHHEFAYTRADVELACNALTKYLHEGTHHGTEEEILAQRLVDLHVILEELYGQWYPQDGA